MDRAQAVVDPAIILAFHRLENGFFFDFPCFFVRILDQHYLHIPPSYLNRRVMADKRKTINNK
jgi:hypothetical protein